MQQRHGIWRPRRAQRLSRRIVAVPFSGARPTPRHLAFMFVDDQQARAYKVSSKVAFGPRNRALVVVTRARCQHVVIAGRCLVQATVGSDINVRRIEPQPTLCTRLDSQAARSRRARLRRATSAPVLDTVAMAMRTHRLLRLHSQRMMMDIEHAIQSSRSGEGFRRSRAKGRSTLVLCFSRVSDLVSSARKQSRRTCC